MSKVGLFGIGLETYWSQFEGLLKNLNRYLLLIRHKLESYDIIVIDEGIIDNVNNAKRAAESFKKEDVQIIFLYVSTYALSSTVLPIAQKLKIPFIILNLQPVSKLNYKKFNNLNDRGKMTGIWLEHCQACSVPEISSVFNRSNISYHIITGYLKDNSVWKEVKLWLEALKVLVKIKDNRLGVLGHYYNGMLDVYTDLTKLSLSFGTHIELIEMCELKSLWDRVSQDEIVKKINEFKNVFDVVDKCEIFEIKRAARTSVALDKLIKNHDLGSMAYYYEGQPDNEYENIVTSVIAGNTLLTGNNIPIAGECEVKNAQAMKILAEFGAGGSFSEFYLMDFEEDIVLLGHDGPAHHAIAQEKVKLVPLPLYHGKPGKGLSIEMNVKNGPITLLSIVQGKSKMKLLVAEGESVDGPILKIGNTNSRYKFSLGVKEFINSWSIEGPSHHCAIGVGHIADKIEKFGYLLNLEVIKIC
ncbi:MAG: arabinose isomerase [Flavobacteriaceae bacterium]|nr:arabinose isomerase [Flavobacteriaceae bacterium]|tara:strand:- start:741 stop:2153 length:1413 start_codon:yes stop_codon:yes gene_type:complete